MVNNYNLTHELIVFTPLPPFPSLHPSPSLPPRCINRQYKRIWICFSKSVGLAGNDYKKNAAYGRQSISQPINRLKIKLVFLWNYFSSSSQTRPKGRFSLVVAMSVVAIFYVKS